MPDQQGGIALVVDTSIAVAAELRAAVEGLGRPAMSVSDFESARRELRSREITALVTNVRLGAFNGIHLAYTAKHIRPETRVMVYALRHDSLLAREAQRACAFYERQALVPYALPHFLDAALPALDRRDASLKDRRGSFRGGRRSTDMASLYPLAT